MSTTDNGRVDVAQIIADIKREIAEKGLYDELPAFDQISVARHFKTDGLDTTGLRQRVMEVQGNCMISPVYPSTGSFIKRTYKKLCQRAIRCAIDPMSHRITDTNASLAGCLEYAATVIEQQQRQIAEMDQKLADIAKAVNQGVGRK